MDPVFKDHNIIAIPEKIKSSSANNPQQQQPQQQQTTVISPSIININSNDPRGSMIAVASNNRDSTIFTPTSVTEEFPKQIQPNILSHNRSRSHSQSINSSRQLFQPIHHTGSYHSQYQPTNTQYNEPPIGSKHPMTAPQPAGYRYSQQLSNLQDAALRSRQPNWTTLIPPLPPNEQHQKEPSPDKDEFNFASRPATTPNTPNFPTRSPLRDKQSHSESSMLSPSHRHSIAISPTAPKSQSHDSNPPPLQQPRFDRDMTRELTKFSPPFTSPNNLAVSGSRRKSKKSCHKCGQEITGQFVRALQNAYHVNCFTCHECGKQCSSKFFPYEMTVNGEVQQVPLCEYDYFKKLDLICHNCNSALRGPYITALGNKYHLEHFKCSVCQRVFESDESYYEHEGQIYCHYHYSVSYASHCEGCNSSIVKQFVELFRGGRNQHWHPECYMVHKFWNVCITADSVGLQNLHGIADDDLLNLQLIKIQESKEELDHKLLLSIEQSIERVVMRCWLTLSGYEETTASCISDMLLNACTGNKFNGLVVTGKLILNVEVLFKALDFVFEMCQNSTALLQEKIQPIQRSSSQPQPPHDGSDDGDSSSSNPEEEYFQQLKKEPRNITGKIMSYLAVLRKSDHLAKSGSLSAELLSVITGCAHYLKLLIRIGLHNALKLNRLYGNTTAIDKFLLLTAETESISSLSDERQQLPLINSRLTIPAYSTDACMSCSKSIERSCFKQGNNRWHVKCVICSSCGRGIGPNEARVTKVDRGSNDRIICQDCPDGNNTVVGFEIISDLSQLVFLLKIALARSRSVMKVDFTNPPADFGISKDKGISRVLTTGGSTPSREQLTASTATATSYSQTLDDVTTLRRKRQSQKLFTSVKKSARKSVILEVPEGTKASQDEIRRPNVTEDHIAEELADLSFEQIPSSASATAAQPNRVGSTTSQLSYASQRSEHLNVKPLIRDEPQRQQSNIHLDRTSDMLKNEKSLTLDDIPRIVAAEQARDQRPNAFKHHNTLYQRQSTQIRMKPGTRSPSNLTPSGVLDNILSSGRSVDESQSFKKTKYYSELSKEEHFILRHIAVEALVHVNSNNNIGGCSKDDLIGFIQKKKQSTFWDKFKFSSDVKKDKVMAVFGVDLFSLTRKYGIDSDLGVGPSKVRIPIVIDDVINALRQKDMSVEGIFRLNGNIKKLRELTEEINKNPLKSPDFSNQSAVQLAALMKKWLRELPNPLLTYNLYDIWISSQRERNPALRKRILQLAYCMLPRSHRNLVEVLLYFFSWVASFSEIDEETGSKMDIHNLATVVAPNVLISKQNSQSNDNMMATQQPGDNYFLAIEVVNQLIETHEELSIIPHDLWNFYETCGFPNKLEKELSSKEISNIIEKYLKEDPNYFDDFDVKNPEGIANLEVRSNTILKTGYQGSGALNGETQQAG
ncbi:rga1 [[Candida] subhashii]|uniref:Rga1 n=1 Tax=[Candida] subhashii TaxID=561895 RepID=A0A8J5QJD5_9ASCO|nr:rga1 [[Candida] subhashii]KAG7663208.1 rga1 [[Candida] subhashii]